MNEVVGWEEEGKVPLLRPWPSLEIQNMTTVCIYNIYICVCMLCVVEWEEEGKVPLLRPWPSFEIQNMTMVCICDIYTCVYLCMCGVCMWCVCMFI